jgi:hypothetical protein
MMLGDAVPGRRAVSVNYREIWEGARRRVLDRYLRANPGVQRARAFDIVSNRHEEIGAEMDRIEGKPPQSERTEG